MDRRTALSRITLLFGAAASASTVSAILAGCSTPSVDGFSPRVLSSSELDLLGRLSNLVIPDTDTPGALAAGVPRFIDTLLAEYLLDTDAQSFKQNLATWAESTGASSLSDNELLALVTNLDERTYSGSDDTQKPFWGDLKMWTVFGYYTSEIGMTQELRLRPYVKARMDMPRAEIDRTWSN
ncbi:MAG: gluconate 2-dehydrogenase subunit 3 family protein [Bacteroidetes bacterium]|nr:gluconate 2-dehydrogenase subunit 3 family protein [Bacteroidota bacterium]MDA1334103.1 gluconate 2-dehydrogenase subunit 3 family protein [Bacteroidota bacterium]